MGHLAVVLLWLDTLALGVACMEHALDRALTLPGGKCVLGWALTLAVAGTLTIVGSQLAMVAVLARA